MAPDKSKLYSLFFFIYLIGISFGNTIIQLISIISLSFIGLFLVEKNKVFFPFKDAFYFGITIISAIQLLLFYKHDYSINYIINSTISTVVWFVMGAASIVTLRLISVLPIEKVKSLLEHFFKLNMVIIAFQYVAIAFQEKSIIPFISYMGAGDFLKGIFSNSSVTMVVLSFYMIYFIYIKSTKNAILALTGILFTTFMSGMVLFAGTAIAFAFWYLSFKNKIKIFFLVLSLFIAFSILSPKNVDYVKSNLTEKLFAKSDQARKIVSFEQTIDFSTSSISNFLFGAGGGKFSSRTAFITAGEYVNWFPKQFVYISESFNDNHFKLWNNDILRKPYKDGTANQPFSFYNQIFGEYGFIGFLLFIVFYLYYPIKYYKNLTYGKLLIFLILSYFILDYWFEYFTVIIFFELFLYMDIKKINMNAD